MLHALALLITCKTYIEVVHMLTLLLDRACVERENHDLRMEQLKVQAAEDRITTLKKAAEYRITVMKSIE